MKDIGLRLKTLRENKQMTQSAMGAMVGEPVGNYQNYEYGDSNPSIEQLILFAKGLETSIEYIIRGRKNNYVYEEKVIPFPKRLKELRVENHMTQAQVADILGNKLRNYQKYEYGETVPTMERLTQLADLFHVTMDDLLGRVRK